MTACNKWISEGREFDPHSGHCVVYSFAHLFDTPSSQFWNTDHTTGFLDDPTYFCSCQKQRPGETFDVLSNNSELVTLQHVAA